MDTYSGLFLLLARASENLPQKNAGAEINESISSYGLCWRNVSIKFILPCKIQLHFLLIFLFFFLHISIFKRPYSQLEFFLIYHKYSICLYKLYIMANIFLFIKVFATL